MTYIEADKIEQMREALQFILNTAEYYIDPTPGHERGCAREAWLDQAQYWMDKLDELVPGEEGNAKLSVMIMCIALFTADYRSVLKNLGINP